jgi:flagellar basal-body rod protein FlgG
MLRALWTAGQGMVAQQTNVDVISNNLANVNTTGYKKQRVEFKDLLYTTLQRGYLTPDDNKPVNLQVGHGVTPSATVRSFATGNFEKTDNPLDIALDGEGFFQVRGPGQEKVFTRDGSFKLALTNDGNMLTTSDGYAVLDETGAPIMLEKMNVEDLIVGKEGALSFLNRETGLNESLGQKLGIVKFQNRNGLENIGSNFFTTTPASGQPIADSEAGKPTMTNQYFLESANVQVVEEMVKLIVAQRAYEINSKAIQTSDDMLNTANNLKR